MQKIIICYSLGSIEPKERVKFNRELYGYKDSSNHGNYSYKRNGILSKLKYEKPLDSVIIVWGNAQPIIQHLKSYGSKYVSYKIS